MNAIEINRRIRQVFTLLCLIISLPARGAGAPDFETRVETILSQFQPVFHSPSHPYRSLPAPPARFQYQNCQNYPYHNTHTTYQSHRLLSDDIRQGLATGLRCLAGLGPAGKLHHYHESQALKLLSILENDQPKTVRCVQDEIFAYAIANTPKVPGRKPHPQDALTEGLPYPGILLDTFRLSGAISKKHDEQTYRDFYHLSQAQIHIIKTGKPLRLDGMHRYVNRDALMFHEMIHWLGHEHSSLYPDTTHLYETCCFGGSDFISDDDNNQKFRTQACNILKDDDIWSASRYRQMRLWRYKAYDQLKSDMRSATDW